jgi:hypothetical protein
MLSHGRMKRLQDKHTSVRELSKCTKGQMAKSDPLTLNIRYQEKVSSEYQPDQFISLC